MNDAGNVPNGIMDFSWLDPQKKHALLQNNKLDQILIIQML